MELDKAKTIYDGLQTDIQTHIMKEYIEPQLKCDDLINSFHTLIESDECQRLNCTVLIEPVTKIIENKEALSKMCELNTLGFSNVYNKHFIQKINTFARISCPYTSMCMEFVMIKWH